MDSDTESRCPGQFLHSIRIWANGYVDVLALAALRLVALSLLTRWYDELIFPSSSQ